MQIVREIPLSALNPEPRIIAPPAFLRAAGAFWMVKHYAARDRERFCARSRAMGREPTKDDTEGFDALITLAIDEINRAAWAYELTYSEACEALQAYFVGCDVAEARKRITALPRE